MVVNDKQTVNTTAQGLQCPGLLTSQRSIGRLVTILQYPRAALQRQSTGRQQLVGIVPVGCDQIQSGKESRGSVQD